MHIIAFNAATTVAYMLPIASEIPGVPTASHNHASTREVVTVSATGGVMPVETYGRAAIHLY
eukprot:10886-Eustigmatos_ZCMA.PRE.1